MLPLSHLSHTRDAPSFALDDAWRPRLRPQQRRRRLVDDLCYNFFEVSDDLDRRVRRAPRALDASRRYVRDRRRGCLVRRLELRRRLCRLFLRELMRVLERGDLLLAT